VAGELGALEEFARKLTRRKVLGFLDINFSGSGLINGQRLCDILDNRLKGITIEAMTKRFVAVATEIGTGHEIWLSRGRLVDAMRASYALPGIFRPVAINTQTNTIFVLNAVTSTISVFDGRTNTLTGTITVPVPDGAVVTVPFGSPEPNPGNSYLNLAAGTLTSLGGAIAMAVNELDNVLYVANVNGTGSAAPPNLAD